MGTSLTPAGRAMHVTHAAIAGLVSCLPQQIVPNSFFTEKFDQNTINDVIKIIGVKNRHWCHADTSTVDLCNFAAHRLLQELDWSPDSVDAIIFVSQTPNYRLPASACVLKSWS